MAELGLIASIIQVVGAGVRLSLTLNAIGCEIAAADFEILSIAKSISLFTLILKQVGAALQESDSVHSTEAIETAREIKTQCEWVFHEIQDMLDKVRKKDEYGNVTGSSLQQKFKWCFKKGRVSYLLGQLESLKLSLVVMLQVLHLGKLMASNPARKDDLIAQERAEVQNTLVVRYWSMDRLNKLYDTAEDEAEHDNDQKSIEASPVENRPLALGPPPSYNETSKALIRLPIVSLGELDASLSAIRGSPGEMYRVSDAAIDPLLSRWTRIDDLREQAKKRAYHQNGSYSSHFPYEYYETDSDESPTSPVDVRVKGYYLEGTTTDWRAPHSTDARRERAQLRKQYEGFQAKVDDDNEDRDEDRPLRKRAPSKHVIDSDDESQDETRLQHQRRSSESSRLDKQRPKHKQPTDRPRSYTPDTRHFSDKYLSSPRGSTAGIYPNARPPMPQQQRPMPTPSQMPPFHHTVSLPPPSVHGQPSSPNRTPHGSISSPYQPPPPYLANPRGQPSPGYLQPQQHPQQQQQQQQRIPPPPLAIPLARDMPQIQPGSRRSSMAKREKEAAREEKREKEERRKKDFRKGATTGILGGVGIASVLDALEGLAI